MNTIEVRPAGRNRRKSRWTLRAPVAALAVILLSGMLGGCAIPPALAVAGYLGDGVLSATTGKGSTDTGLSLATGRDCATFRLLKGEDVCRDNVEAKPEAVPVEVAQDEAAQRRRVEAMPADEPSRSALSDRILADAFQPLAGAAPLPRQAGAGGPVVVAALPLPASSDTVVASLEPAPKAVRVASVHRRHHGHRHAMRTPTYGHWQVPSGAAAAATTAPHGTGLALASAPTAPAPASDTGGLFFP